MEDLCFIDSNRSGSTGVGGKGGGAAAAGARGRGGGNFACGCDVSGPHVHLRRDLTDTPGEPIRPSKRAASLPTSGAKLPSAGTKREACSPVQPPQPTLPPQPQPPGVQLFTTSHRHGPSCGHKRIRHGDHFDYIVPRPDGSAELHHPYTEPSTGEQRCVVPPLPACSPLPTYLPACLPASLPGCVRACVRAWVTRQFD